MKDNQTSLGRRSGGNRVLVVGGVSIDLAAFSSKAPVPGETVIGHDFKLVLGGKGSNQAIAASLAGSQCSLVSCIGDDIFSNFAKETLSEFRVDTEFTDVVEGPTGIAHIRVGDDGENNIVVIPLANSKIAAPQVERAFATDPKFDVLLLQLEIPWEVNLRAMEIARSNGTLVILDPAPAAQIDEKAWGFVSIVTPNETEAKALTAIAVTDEASARAAGKWFIDRGVDRAAITVGAAGVYLVDQEGVRLYPAPRVNAIDTTAAGDAFTGYLGALLAQGEEIEKAIEVAVSAASLSVTKIGASSSLPTRAEVNSFRI